MSQHTELPDWVDRDDPWVAIEYELLDLASGVEEVARQIADHPPEHAEIRAALHGHLARVVSTAARAHAATNPPRSSR